METEEYFLNIEALVFRWSVETIDFQSIFPNKVKFSLREKWGCLCKKGGKGGGDLLVPTNSRTKLEFVLKKYGY